MVDEPLAQAMNDAAANFPVGTSEPEVLGLALAESMTVRVPRLAAAPFALECRKSVSLVFGPGREILVGEVTGPARASGAAGCRNLAGRFHGLPPGRTALR